MTKVRDIRLSHWLHRYLPETVQKRFRQRFEIAPGISAERDYGTASAEFNVEKFAGVAFDEQTRAEVDAATEGLKAFLLHLVSDCHYDFSDQAVRQALIQTAEQLAQEFAGAKEESETQCGDDSSQGPFNRPKEGES